MTNAKPSSIIFPDWSQVIHSLFKTTAFKKAGLSEANMTHYLAQRKVFKDKYDFPVSGADMIAQAFELGAMRNLGLSYASEEETLKAYNALSKHANQFTLLGNANQIEFIKVSENAKEILDIPFENDINLARISGMDDNCDLELYHPLDVGHIVRLGLSAIFVSTVDGVTIKPFEDFYWVSFRIGYKDPKRFKTILRKCRLSNSQPNKPGARHLDTWEVHQTHENFDHVRANIEIKDGGHMREVVQSLFFATNCFLLDLSPRDVILAQLMSQYDQHHYQDALNAHCSETIGIKSEYFNREQCATLRRNLSRKVDTRIVEATKGVDYKKLASKMNFNWKCGQLGVANSPLIINQCIWRQVAAISHS